MEKIGSLLGFKSNANEMVEVEDGELDEFWTKIAKMSIAKGRI